LVLKGATGNLHLKGYRHRFAGFAGRIDTLKIWQLINILTENWVKEPDVWKLIVLKLQSKGAKKASEGKAY